MITDPVISDTIQCPFSLAVCDTNTLTNLTSIPSYFSAHSEHEPEISAAFNFTGSISLPEDKIVVDEIFFISVIP